jgi:hypothetical protein
MHECDFDTLDCHLYTQSAIFTRKCDFDTHECHFHTHKCDLDTQHIACDFKSNQLKLT